MAGTGARERAVLVRGRDNRRPGAAVIVLSDESTVSITQFKDGIVERIGDARRAKGRADSPGDDVGAVAPSKDESSNHHIAPCAHERAGTDVSQL